MAARVVLAGGGTAGHLFPSLAVAQELAELDPAAELLFIGSRRGIDGRLLAEAGLPHVLLGAMPFPYRLSWAMVRSAGALAASTVAAHQALRSFRPQVVFASGGYVAAPAVLAARVLRVPAVIHAGDVQVDRTNRLLSRFAARITLAFEGSARYLPADRVVHTGPPLRRELFGHAREEGLARFGFDPARTTLLVTGGSQGAQALNESVIGALPRLLARGDLQVLHLTGEAHYERIAALAAELGAPASAYRPLGFFARMGLAYAAADLVLSRAGSSSVGEALALGKPMILVPYPHAGGHQMQNAIPVAEAGAALIIRDEELSGQSLCGTVEGLLDDRPRLEAMAEATRRVGRPDAARRIAELLLELACGRR